METYFILDNQGNGKPEKLKIKHLPPDFSYKNKYNQPVGPTIEDFNNEYKFKIINLDTMKSGKLKTAIENLNPKKHSSIVPITELTPEILLQLETENGIGDNSIQLSNDQVRLLEAIQRSKMCKGKQSMQDLDKLPFKELPKWVFEKVPEINKVTVAQNLGSMRTPRNTENAK